LAANIVTHPPGQGAVEGHVRLKKQSDLFRGTGSALRFNGFGRLHCARKQGFRNL
jgi:hypothetical protein